jgi:hypothetical protein
MPHKPFSGRAASTIGPATAMTPVTPDDDNDLLQGVTRSIFVSGGGQLSVFDAHGQSVTLVSGDAQYHPIAVRRVCATGTTATGIIALY